MSDKGAWVKGAAHWREGDVAFISVAFTWLLPEARRIAEYYRAIGVNLVRVGGPGTFTQKKYVAEFADEVGGSIPDDRSTRMGEHYTRHVEKEVGRMRAWSKKNG